MFLLHLLNKQNQSCSLANFLLFAEYQNPPVDPTHSQMNTVKTHNDISVI